RQLFGRQPTTLAEVRAGEPRSGRVDDPGNRRVLDPVGEDVAVGMVDPCTPEIRHMSVYLDGVQPPPDSVTRLDNDAVDSGCGERVGHGETGDAGAHDDPPPQLPRDR